MIQVLPYKKNSMKTMAWNNLSTREFKPILHKSLVLLMEIILVEAINGGKSVQ